jgi:hypothetical protein
MPPCIRKVIIVKTMKFTNKHQFYINFRKNRKLRDGRELQQMWNHVPILQIVKS